MHNYKYLKITDFNYFKYCTYSGKFFRTINFAVFEDSLQPQKLIPQNLIIV